MIVNSPPPRIKQGNYYPFSLWNDDKVIHIRESGAKNTIIC